MIKKEFAEIYSGLTVMKKRIAFIVQRYGKEVNGGAEFHCKLIAERLTSNYDVDVLTSCAQDYRTWDNKYQPGREVINKVNVLRFPTEHPRLNKKFRSLSRKFSHRKPYFKVLRFLGLLKSYHRLVPPKFTAQDNFNWAKFQGPYVPSLLEYLKAEEGKYDVLIFFTYLYYPTICGIAIRPEKSILIPTAHDEPPIYFPVFKDLFSKPKAILYNTLAEKRFVNRLFNNEQVYDDVVGVGIENVDLEGDGQSHHILKNSSPYLIYIGRIDVSKGCKILCEYFLKYKQQVDTDLKLILVGQPFMKIPVHADIIVMGFVDEGIKRALLKDAKALVIPSFYESLSMVTLEGMAQGIPIIANSHCEVLQDHIENSKAGFTFDNFDTFKVALNTLFSEDTSLELLQLNGRRYVKENYQWDVVLNKIKSAIEFIAH